MRVRSKRQESILHQHQSCTTASFCDNTKKAYCQAHACKHVLDQDPPVLDPPKYITGVDMKNNKWLNEPKPPT